MWKRGGRKLVISPDGVSAVASSRPRVDNTMVKALARAFRWRKLLETGVFATVEKIAAAEKINSSYVGRVLRLNHRDSCCECGRFAPEMRHRSPLHADQIGRGQRIPLRSVPSKIHTTIGRPPWPRASNETTAKRKSRKPINQRKPRPRLRPSPCPRSRAGRTHPADSARNSSSLSLSRTRLGCCISLV